MFLAGGASGGHYDQFAVKRGIVKPVRPRQVDRVIQVIPIRYLKKIRAKDVLKSRAEAYRERYTPGETEVINYDAGNLPVNSILEGISAMRNVTNADVRGESNATKARLAFLTWLRKNHPKVYSNAIQMTEADPYDSQFSGIFDSISGAIGKIDFSKLSDNVIKAGTGLIALKSQKDILKLNLARAKAGEPPVDPSIYGQAPVIRTEIDLQPELAARIRDSATMPLLIGGAALVAILLLRKR